jgi:hypothetical protein
MIFVLTRNQQQGKRRRQMEKTERKLRSDLTAEQKAEALRIGDLSYRSNRKDPHKMQIMVKYAGVGPKGRAA